MAPDRIRVLIADDDRLVRLVLTELIASDNGMELVAVAQDATEAITMAQRHRPHVALLDVTMPGGGGATATKAILSRRSATRVLALSASSERSAIKAMLDAGAVGYLTKGTGGADLLEGIRRTARGKRAISSKVASELADEVSEALAERRATSMRYGRQKERVRRVIDEQLVTPVFQPIVELQEGAVTAFEALARFPRQGPNVWFQLAADVGLRESLELEAIRAASGALEAIPEPVRLSVNASPSTVVTGALNDLLESVASRMIVEITEHAPVEDYDALSASLEPLRAAGALLAVDDAGAGYASLRHILRLDPDIIKIDETLTQRVAQERAPRALTAALVYFAREIEATVVAEGVETAQQLEALVDIGASHAQGYHLGRPGPLASVTGSR